MQQRIIAFAPILIIELLFTIAIGSIMMTLNDVMVFDTAQEVSFGQGITLNKDYWLDSALHNTSLTMIAGIIIGSLVFLLNRLIFKGFDFKHYSIYALISAMISVTIINHIGLYGTINMLMASYPKW